MSKQSFSTIITGYRSHLRETKISKISWGGMPPRPPTMHWHALHAANLSKPPYSEKIVYAHVYNVAHIGVRPGFN